MQENEEKPHCRFFVQRKKRFCRMTVRPGKNYCGEHEPEPQTGSGELDIRVPCPLDPKHTCYASKLQKHLTICNAKQGNIPEYIVHNINAPSETITSPRKPLSQIPKEDVKLLIKKVNDLYEKHIKDNITTLPALDIHPTVLPEFREEHRTESSRRHLRQASQLLQLLEKEGLVRDHTCYVELGAGKGHLSYYVCSAWCSPYCRDPAGAGAGTGSSAGPTGAGTGSCVLLIDRAALRHKRDNKLKDRTVVERVRADLAHVSLARTLAAARSARLVGLAKHLCGVASDYALRCITECEVLPKTAGAVLATCCHHRCEQPAFVANRQLRDLGVSTEEFNILLGIVSWATCGDGRSREQRHYQQNHAPPLHYHDTQNNKKLKTQDTREHSNESGKETQLNNSINEVNHINELETQSSEGSCQTSGSKDSSWQSDREEVGRRAKALIDWARVLYLRDKGFDARLCYFVPTSVSLENVCIIAKKGVV